MSNDYVSLQAPCKIFVDRSVWFGQLITRSLAYDFHSDFIYQAEYTVLLLVSFISFRILVIELNCGHSMYD
jgi:hypothetical protein